MELTFVVHFQTFVFLLGKSDAYWMPVGGVLKIAGWQIGGIHFLRSSHISLAKHSEQRKYLTFYRGPDQCKAALYYFLLSD